MTNKLALDVVSQEKRLLTEEVDNINIETAEGEITILPDHAPLLTKLAEGILTYTIDGTTHYIAIFGGFMDVGPDSKVTILADSATRAEDIDDAKVMEAKKLAEESLKDQASEQDLAMAEAALRKAALELRVAQRHRGGSSTSL